MRPTQAIATLAVAAVTGITGVTLTVGLATPTPSDDAASAARATEAPPVSTPISSLGTAAASPTSPRHNEPVPHRHLAPRPPADGRDAPDPFLLQDGRRWVLYSTQAGLHNVPVATATELAAWSPPIDALPQLPAWAEWGRTWAPGVLRRPGEFELYFAAHSRVTGRQCIGVATSTSAAGPFTSTSPEPLVCQPHLGGSIDPHPFVDADGTAYLLWKADGNALGRASLLYSQRLRPDGLAVTGDATPLMHNDAAWETPLVENPAMLRIDGRYILLYSAGWWESDSYAIGYAMCDTPVGPCTKATTERPLHSSNRNIAGPGGACLIAGPAGDLWFAHHAWTPGAIGYRAGGARSLHFTPLHWDGTRLTVQRAPAPSP
jgi:beta-xylosidase